MNDSISYFDAYIHDHNMVALLSKLDLLTHDDYRHSRLFTWVNGTWGHRDIPFMSQSIVKIQPKSGIPPYQQIALGEMSGAIEVCWPRGAKIDYEFLPGATRERGLLHLKQIKEIAGDLYVAGTSSQVYRRLNDQWIVFNQGLEEPAIEDFEAQGMSQMQAIGALTRYCSLNSIDGTAANDLYTVGNAGVMCHRGNDTWSFLPKVSNANLHRVKCVSKDLVIAVGDGGILLRGNARDGFEALQTGLNDNLWSVEEFNGKTYLGGATRGLFRTVGDQYERVPGLPEFDCHTLHANAGQLLAVGAKHVYLTDDGKNWKQLKNPDNE